MKKILVIFSCNVLLLAMVIFSCNEKTSQPTSTVTVNDEKSKKVSAMMKSYVLNNFDASILSDDAIITFNQLEMTKDEFENIGNIHHSMFNSICFPDGWIETVCYLGSDVKNSGGLYTDHYGEIWTNQWTDWSGIFKISGDTLSNPSYFGYKWEGEKIVRIRAIFSDEPFNIEFRTYLEESK